MNKMLYFEMLILRHCAVQKYWQIKGLIIYGVHQEIISVLFRNLGMFLRKDSH
jgi:hypothetical protein